MFLAGILGLCALLNSPAWDGSSEYPFFAQSIPRIVWTTQDPANPSLSKSDSQEPDAPQASPPQTSQPGSPTPEQKPADKPAAKDSAKPKPTVAKNPKPAQKKPAPPATADPGPKKIVVRQGSTLEPTTQLAPGITDEQAARQRQTTKQLLSSTGEALQQLNGRLLTDDERATVAQIRVFVQQSKAADKAGDLQRAYKLAVKAHLLSDALVKP